MVCRTQFTYALAQRICCLSARTAKPTVHGVRDSDGSAALAAKCRPHLGWSKDVDLHTTPSNEALAFQICEGQVYPSTAHPDYPGKVFLAQSTDDQHVAIRVRRGLAE